MLYYGQGNTSISYLKSDIRLFPSQVTDCPFWFGNEALPQMKELKMDEMDLWYVWNVNWLTVSLSSSAVRFSAFKRSLITLVNNFSDVICLRGWEVSYFFFKDFEVLKYDS